MEDEIIYPTYITLHMTSSVANPNGLREATADRNTVSLPELPFNSGRDNNKLTTNTHWLFCSFLSRYFVAKERKKNFFPVKLTGAAKRGCIWDSVTARSFSIGFVGQRSPPGQQHTNPFPCV